ncbi:lipase/acyltransferase domain-containing protein [Amycolatopsis lurida]
MAPSELCTPGRDVSHDAVVVIPGIMGTALRDIETGRDLWGLRSLGWYRKAWTTGASLRALQLTEAEHEGIYGRVQPTGLLRFPAWAPLDGIEPYTNLVKGIRSVVTDDAAILAFGYDWRLPVEHNAALLARAARRHLDTWRATPEHESARRTQPDGRPARLVLVAHSMGGLLARALPLVEDRDDIPAVTSDIRATITLGTPFDGAAKAALIMSAGTGTPLPLPRGRLRRLAATMPGLHDLLPVYRCVDTGAEVRCLTASEVGALGGNAQLADTSFRFRRRLVTTALVGHRALVGVDQPTLQTLRLRDGAAEGFSHTFRVNSKGSVVCDQRERPVPVAGSGDGTVPRNSASPDGASLYYEAQQHGSLAKVDEAITFVRSVITEQEPGGRLGTGHLGVGAPDLVEPDAAWSAVVTGIDGPNDVTCRVHDAETGGQVDAPRLRWEDGEWRFTTSVPGTRLYQVVVSGGGGSPVTRYVLATNPAAREDDD